MSRDCNLMLLPHLGVLRAHGAEVVPFLQGQLSNDIALLSGARALFAGYHNPQGRVIALLRLLQPAPQEVLAIVPRELAPALVARLSKFILRAKVKIADESAAWQVRGMLAGAHSAATPSAGATLPDGCAPLGEGFAVCVSASPRRWLWIAPAAAATPATLSACEPAGVEVWTRASIAAGEPQVYTRTSEEFVAQMLNLDALGGIAFDKGCYTGQEVIARAHYRGRVKRRLQRFVSDQPVALAPGDSGEFADGRSFKIVEAASRPDGRCEFLAVTALSAEAAVPGTDTTGLAAQPLALPYRLPE
jgi:folate-binding protein YgfZ